MEKMELYKSDIYLQEEKSMELYLIGKYRVLVVKIFGELDHHKATAVRESVDRELGRTGAVNVAFDFGKVTFMDSSGIGVIMGRYKITNALGGKVIVYGASESVEKIIKMAGIDEIVTLSDSLENGMREAALNV